MSCREELEETKQEVYQFCESTDVYMSEYGIIEDYCPKCGQKLDWS